MSAPDNSTVDPLAAQAPTQTIIADSDADFLEKVIILVGTEGLCYGVCVILGVMSFYILIRRGFRQNPFRLFLLFVVLLMFISSTISFANTIIFYMAQIRAAAVTPYDFIPVERRTSILKEVCSRINFIFGDAVVVWRAWVMYDTRTRSGFPARVLLALSLTATIVVAFVDGALTIRATLQSPSGSNGLDGPMALLLPLPLLITNVLATLLIAYKTWSYRTHIKAALNVKGKTRVEAVLILLLESGLIYSVFLILTTIGRLNVWGDYGYAVFASSGPYLTNIYPTIIIIIVSLQNSEIDTMHSSEHDSGRTNSQVITRPLAFASTVSAHQTHSNISTSPNSETWQFSGNQGMDFKLNATPQSDLRLKELS